MATIQIAKTCQNSVNAKKIRWGLFGLKPNMPLIQKFNGLGPKNLVLPLSRYFVLIYFIDSRFTNKRTMFLKMLSSSGWV
jgi:hypothetical protein